jgi:hypothetical protein
MDRVTQPTEDRTARLSHRLRDHAEPSIRPRADHTLEAAEHLELKEPADPEVPQDESGGPVVTAEAGQEAEQLGPPGGVAGRLARRHPPVSTTIPMPCSPAVSHQS